MAELRCLGDMVTWEVRHQEQHVGDRGLIQFPSLVPRSYKVSLPRPANELRAIQDMAPSVTPGGLDRARLTAICETNSGDRSPMRGFTFRSHQNIQIGWCHWPSDIRRKICLWCNAFVVAPGLKRPRPVISPGNSEAQVRTLENGRRPAKAADCHQPGPDGAWRKSNSLARFRQKKTMAVQEHKPS